MIRRFTLLAPEGDGAGGGSTAVAEGGDTAPGSPQDSGAAFARAGQAAMARIAASGPQPSGAEAQAQEQATAPPQAAPPTAQQQAAARSWKYQFQGQEYEFPEEDVNALIEHGLRAIEQAGASQQQPQQGGEQPQAEGEQPKVAPEVKAAMERLERLEQAEEQRKNEARLQTTMKELDDAFSANPELKKISERLPKESQFLRGVVLTIKGYNPRMSTRQAADYAVESLTKLFREERKEYLQGKIAQNSRGIEGSGGAAPTTSGKKLGSADLHNGGVIRSAIARAKAMMSSRQ